MLGAYRETLRLLEIIGVNENEVFDRHTLKLRMYQAGHPDTRLTFPRLPAPLHVIFGIALADGLSLDDRWRALKMCISLISPTRRIVPDISVYAFLKRKGQGDKVIATLWQPLCLAILNTPIDTASAEIFIRSIKDAFARKRSDSDLLYTRANLGNILPDPARRYIHQQGGVVKLRHRVTRLLIGSDKITGVELSNGTIMETEHVILAVPPLICKKLLEPHQTMNRISEKLARLDHAPICTVYIQYPPVTRLSLPMIGLIGTTAQWIFDRGFYNRPGLMAVVISSNGPHMQMDNDALCKRVISEISGVFPAWPDPVESYVVREKMATFLCRTNINTIRPATVTPVSGCLLAGDFTATDYPATLEGAVRSGVKAAQLIINSYGKAN